MRCQMLPGGDTVSVSKLFDVLEEIESPHTFSLGLIHPGLVFCRRRSAWAARARRWGPPRHRIRCRHPGLSSLPATLLGLRALTHGDRLQDTTRHIRLPRQICLRVATGAYALTSARADTGVYLS
jgi:hypothetical protein